MSVDTLDTVQILDQFERDHMYLEDNRSEWVQKYPDRWVGVYKEDLICSKGSFKEALDEADRRGIRPYMVIEFITDQPRTLIL